MLKSCKYCGGIHDSKYICPRKPRRSVYKKETKPNEFRKTNAWKEKSLDIRSRDNFMCQVCIRELYDTENKYNYTNIQVHHIVPVSEDFELRLEQDNLISLCKYHHDLAEDGKISIKELVNIVKEQEANYMIDSTPLG